MTACQQDGEQQTAQTSRRQEMEERHWLDWLEAKPFTTLFVSGNHENFGMLTDFLEEVSQRCRFKYHFFGHYHTNRVIREKYVLLYEQIIRLKL